MFLTHSHADLNHQSLEPMQVHLMKRGHMKQLCNTARNEKNMRVCCVCLHTPSRARHSPIFVREMSSKKSTVWQSGLAIQEF